MRVEMEDRIIEEIGQDSQSEMEKTQKEAVLEADNKEKNKRPAWKEILSWCMTLLAAFVLAIVLKNYVIINATVPTGSMENTIEPGDDLFGFRLAYKFAEPERGDIVIFRFPDDESQKYVKRVIGLPGEKVTITEGKIYINNSDVPLEEDYLKEDWVRATGPFSFVKRILRTIHSHDLEACISNVRQNRKGGSVIMPENASCSGAATCSKGSCEGCASKQNPQSMLEAMNAYSDVKHVIGVVSGKGGVGKSFVTASLAVKMAKAGYKVGILDADITGPSIPKMFGAHGQVVGDDKGMYPYETKEGIKIISINLLMEDEEAPVVWRGPVIAGAVKQFWNETVWGEVDYLFVDMPPGTGDVPLTVFQSLPVDGIVIVTSPQELVQMIVKKAFNMANMMHIPVLGVVENFSYLKCPDCGKQIKLFGESHIDEVAAGLGTKVLGKLPLDPEYAQHADAGEFYQMENSYLDDAVNVLKNI